MRSNSSQRAGQFFGRSLIRAAAVGLPLLVMTLLLAPVASASGPYPPRFILPALRQPQARPGFGPAIAFYGSQRFYLAWTGSATSKVFYSAYGSNCKHFSLTPCWAPQATVSGPWGHALASGSPALVDYGSDLYAFWPDLATKKVFYSAYNGSSWGAEATVSGSWGTATTDLPVALAVYNGDLYAAWGTLGKISYSFFNGSSWSPSTTIPSLPSKRLGFAALVVYQSELYLFWVAQGGGTGYSIYNGSVWTSATSITGTWGSAVSVTGLAVAACDGDLFAAWVNGFSTAEQSIRY